MLLLITCAVTMHGGHVGPLLSPVMGGFGGPDRGCFEAEDEVHWVANHGFGLDNASTQ